MKRRKRLFCRLFTALILAGFVAVAGCLWAHHATGWIGRVNCQLRLRYPNREATLSGYTGRGVEVQYWLQWHPLTLERMTMGMPQGTNKNVWMPCETKVLIGRDWQREFFEYWSTNKPVIRFITN